MTSALRFTVLGVVLLLGGCKEKPNAVPDKLVVRSFQGRICEIMLDTTEYGYYAPTLAFRCGDAEGNPP